MRIDSHQHFWIYDKQRDAWINEDMQPVIGKDFLPNDISSILKQSKIDGTVAVQASESEDETKFLVELSKVYALIKGVVGWIDLHDENLDSRLDYWSNESVVKGFRHVIEGEPKGDYLMQNTFQRGLTKLSEKGYTYDLLIRPRHFQSTLDCVAKQSNLTFVLDHMAKPNIAENQYDDWASFIKELAQFPNVYCKLSGIVTEAKWHNWQVEDLKPYVDFTLESFGAERVLYGSDWPVCTLSSSYEQWVNAVESLIGELSESERKMIWGGNAIRVYNLKDRKSDVQGLL